MEKDADAYRRIYKLRVAQGNNSKRSYEVTFPYDVLDKEARKNGLSVEQFVKQFKAVALYNGFEGVRYQFEKVADK